MAPWLASIDSDVRLPDVVDNIVETNKHEVLELYPMRGNDVIRVGRICSSSHL